MVAGFVLVLIGAVGALVAWFAWSSPGNVSGLFDINLGDLTPGFALRFGAVPGSQSGLASSRGSLGVVVAVVLIAVAVATWYTKDRRNVLVGCECGLVVGALGLVVNAYEALHETLNATKAIDDGLDRLLTATAALRSLPVLGTISDTITSEVHHAPARGVALGGSRRDRPDRWWGCTDRFGGLAHRNSAAKGRTRRSVERARSRTIRHDGRSRADHAPMA